MQVTSMLSAGYLEPVNKISRVYSPNKTEETDVSKQQKEQEILAEEQSLKAKLGNEAQVHTVYHYSMGTDGRRYITGASVTMKGSEEDLNRVSGGITTQELQQKQDEEKLKKQKESSLEQTVSEKIKEENENLLPGKSEENPEEEAQIRELESIQREVIAHENAHKAAAGEFGGGISYSYTEGPDGKSYITGGEVPIKFKEGSTPEETLQNMQKVQRAANAPADPSGQDMKVAAKAASMASKARQEIARDKNDKEDSELKTTVLKGSPVFSSENDDTENSQDKQNPILNGVSSVLASLRAYQIQNLLPAA